MRLQDGFLAPGEEYHYRFATAGADSPVGRFRTARPADSREPVRIAFFSCQEFIAGFYTAHADLAQQDVDLVVCLGDYIYEQAYADNTSRNAPVRSDDSAADGARRAGSRARRSRCGASTSMPANRRSSMTAALRVRACSAL